MGGVLAVGSAPAPGAGQLDLMGVPIYTPVAMNYAGTPTTVSTPPAVVAPGIATTGTIPFAELVPLNYADAVDQEEVLAVNVAGRGIVLIVGCGHPGLPAILARAEAVFDQPVIGVVGGLHYGKATAADLSDEIALLDARGVQIVGLSPHDSGAEALQAFADAFPAAYQSIQVGTPITFGE